MLLDQPLARAVDLQAGAVDEKVQRLVAPDPLRQDRQAAPAAAQRCVVRDSDVDCEHIGDRPQQALGLAQRLVEHQAERGAGLDGSR
jgi:hypothetical protein